MRVKMGSSSPNRGENKKNETICRNMSREITSADIWNHHLLVDNDRLRAHAGNLASASLAAAFAALEASVAAWRYIRDTKWREGL